MALASATPADPPAAPAAPLTIWAVSDGRAGIEAQAVGLAEAVARLRPARISVKRIGWRFGYGALPWWLQGPPRAFLTKASAIDPPWPDLWIAAGRASLPLSMRLRRWSAGKSFVVQLQAPRTPLEAYDLVIPPRHDNLRGDNVFPILGSPQRVTREAIAAAYPAFARMLDPLPAPRVAVLVGGKSKAFDLPPARAAEMATEIQHAVEAKGGSVMVTFSRRTPEDARDLLAARLRHLPGVIWDGAGPNPYFAFLAAADVVLVTEDSTNMAVEAASTGKPVYVLRMQGRGSKFRHFHDELEKTGAARPFEGHLGEWGYPPLRETEKAAEEVLRRMADRG